jgi:hypothetical protein
MSLRGKFIFSGFMLAMTLVAGHAYACKLAVEAYDLNAFLASPGTNKIVFEGRIKSVVNMKAAEDGVRKQKIYFKVDHWWRGKIRNKVVALGIVGSHAGTDCEGQFDFSAQPGEEWLIVGTEEKGFIRPSHLLSKPVIDGALPFEVRQSLGAAQLPPKTK